jgi:mRNA deadenylase 3'-5' endonuclease subunit Ccr4
MSKYNIEIVTYNILSTVYCTKKTYNKTNELYLDTEYRWKLIKEKLQKKVDNNAIICLQEVSHTWLQYILPFFSSANYFCITDNYGSDTSDYMGVLIAYSTKHYKLVNSNIIKIGNELKKLTTMSPPNSNILNKDTNIISKIVNTIWVPGLFNCINYNNLNQQSIKENIKESIHDNDWSSAIYRQNSMLFVRLQSKNNSNIFCVSTYHMPCSIKTSTVIASHSAMLFQQMTLLSGQDPYIIAGDFNIRANIMSPNYPNIYKYICRDNEVTSTKSESDLSNLITIPSKYKVNWRPLIFERLNSAYKTVLGKEPLFTNDSQTGRNDRFTDTLDYIFYSNHSNLKPISVDILPDKIGDICPNKTEPSDHLLIASTFELNITSTKNDVKGRKRKKIE